MALSTAAKAGFGGLGTAAVGGPTVYVVYDKYFSDSLYEVEREVINKNLSLTAGTPSSNQITISAPTNESSGVDSSKLALGNKWSCVVTVTTTPSSSDANTEATAIQKELVGRFLLLNKEQKIDLVESCSKIKNKASKHEVEGTLQLKVINGSNSSKSYKFEGHEKIDYLLDFFFKAVEWEVISKNVQLEKDSTQSSEQNKVKIKAQSNENSGSDNHKLTSGHSWSCEITVTTNPSDTGNTEATTLKNALSTTLPKLTSENKYTLIKACAGTRTTGATDESVAGQLTLNVDVKGSEKTYLSSNNKLDLGFLAK